MRGWGVLGPALAPAVGLGLAAWVASALLPAEWNWYVIRSAGLVTYALLSLSTAAGLLVAARLPGAAAPAAFVVHRTLTRVAFAVLGVHLGAILGDRFVPFDVLQVLGVHWASYRPWAVWLGSATVWLLLVATAAFAWRRPLGASRWRALHRLAFVAWVLALVHGAGAGADNSAASTQWLYASTAVVMTGLLTYRILRRNARGDRTAREVSAPALGGPA